MKSDKHIKNTLTAISIILLFIAVPMGILTVVLTKAPVYTDGAPWLDNLNAIDSVYPEDARREIGGVHGAVLYALSVPTAILGLCRYKKALRAVCAALGILILLFLCPCVYLTREAFFMTLLPLAVCMIIYTATVFAQLSKNGVSLKGRAPAENKSTK